MIYTFGDKEKYLPAYGGNIDPKFSRAIGNRNIGLLFGRRARSSMLWRLRSYIKDDIVLIDETDTEHLLTTIPHVRKLTFGFDFMSYPILAVEVPEGIKVYKYSSYGGDKVHETLLQFIPNAHTPKMIPSNASDLGSVTNQPLLFFVTEAGTLVSRFYKDNFKEDVDEILFNMKDTDELLEVGITTEGKVQIHISSLKQES